MNVTESGPKTEVRFLLQKRQPSGELKFLEHAPTLQEAKDLLEWWVSDSADPESYRKRLRIVKETVVTTYEEVS